MTDLDLAARLDDEINRTAPPPTDWAAAGVRHGRTAVRRRRAATGATVLAVAAAVPLGVSALSHSPGLDRSDSAAVVAAAPHGSLWPAQGDKVTAAILTSAVQAYERQAAPTGRPSLLLAAEVAPGDFRVVVLFDAPTGPDPVAWMRSPADDPTSLTVDTVTDLATGSTWAGAVLPMASVGSTSSAPRPADTAIAVVIGAPGTVLGRAEVRGRQVGVTTIDSSAWAINVPAADADDVVLSLVASGNAITGAPYVDADIAGHDPGRSHTPATATCGDGASGGSEDPNLKITAICPSGPATTAD